MIGHLESLVVVYYCRWIWNLPYFLLEEKYSANLNWPHRLLSTFYVFQRKFIVAPFLDKLEQIYGI